MPSKYDDVIDSRDVIERIEELEALAEEDTTSAPGDVLPGLDDDERAELNVLRTLAADGESASADWRYGETLIRDTYFVEYAQELAEDIGVMPDTSAWPAYCIDWEWAARELRMDYTSVDFDGVTYWIR